MNHQEQRANDRLTKLVPQIQARARHYATRYPQAGVSAEDCAGEAFVAFLVRSQEEPAFLDQPDEDITRRCVLDGWNTRHRRQRRQNRHELPLMEEHIMEDILPDSRPSPEEEAIRSDLADQVRRIVAGLKPKYQIVCRGLMAGLTGSEVMADLLGVRPQNFTWYRQKLAAALEEVAS